MAQRKFNSVEGFSVGIPGNVIAVVDNVANVYANRVFVQQYANLGDIGNIYIGGGTAGYVLKTNGSGNLSWGLDTAPAGGNTTEVQFNTGGSLDGSSAFSFDKITNALSITGNVTSENASLGNLVTSNYFSGTLTTQAQPNVTSVGTLTSLDVTGNVSSAYFIGNGSALTHINGGNVDGQVANALVAGTVYTNAQPNITSLGTLTSLDVSGNISVNYISGDGSELTNITGGNVNGQVSNALVAGTVYTNAQPNITSVGILSSLEVTGDTTLGNVTINGTTGNLSVTNLSVQDNIIDISAETLGTPSNNAGLRVIRGDEPNVQFRWNESLVNWQYTNDGANYYTLVGKDSAGNVSVGNVSATLFTGTLTTNAQPNITSVGTLVSLDVTGNVSADYYFGDGGLLSNISGANVSEVANANYATFAGTVITSAQPNITSVGTLVDANINGNVLIGGNLVVNGSTFYTNVDTLVVEDPIIEQGSGPNAAPLTTNDGKDRGSLLHYYTTKPVDAFMGWDNSAGEFAFGSNVTLSSEVATFNEYGNVHASYYIGNGSQLTGVIGNANYAAYSGNVINASQPNITSVGTLVNTTMGSANSLSGGNLVSANYLTGTLTTPAQPNITSVGTLVNTVIAGANSLTGANLVSANYFTGTLTTNAQPNITSVGTLASLSVTANLTSGNASLGNVVTANYFSGDGSLLTNLTAGSQINNGTSNVKIASSGGNVTVGVNGTNNVVVVASDSLTLTGNLLVSSNILRDSKNVPTYVSSTAAPSNPVIGDQWYDQVNDVTYQYIYDGTSNYWVDISSGYVASNVNAIGNTLVLRDANGNVYANGIYANVLNVAGKSNLGPVGNVIVTGGTSGQYLQTDGAGNLVWSTVAATGAYISNGTSNVNAGTLNGNVTVSIGGTSNTVVFTSTGMTVAGNITSGNATLGNLVTSNYFAGTLTTAAQPNITSVGTLTDANVTGNVLIGGNLIVNGTTEYTNVTNLYVKDPIIELGGGANNAPLTTNDGKDRGSLLHYYTTKVVDAFMGWDNSNGEFAFGSNVSVSSELVTFNSFGNVRAGYFLGNAALLSDVNASSLVSGTISSGILGNSTLYVGTTAIALNRSSGSQSLTGINIDGSANYATYAGTVTTNAQPNITSVGTLSSVSVTANVSAGNVKTDNLLYANGVAWSFGSTYSNANVALYLPTYTGNFTAGNISTTSNVTASYFIGNGSQLTGLPASYSNANVALYLPTYTGNVAANYFIGNGSALTNIAGGNIDGQVANALVAGTVYTNAQPNITSVGTLADLDVSGNVTANYFIGNGATLTFVTGSNVNGQVSNALISGTVYTSAQPNITSVGTLVSLSVTGNVGAGNIKSDNLLYANGDPYVFTTSAAGSNTQIQFNDNTAFAGNANLTFDKSTNTVTTDNIDLNGNLNVTGLSDLGSVANITITGGTSGYVLTTDGSGGLTWGAAGSGAAGLVSISKDRFLTTGSANTFNLSTTPASQNLIEVIIDGLQQISNTYSLAGSTLSFPTNPAAGQVIEVTTFGAVDLTGNIGEVQYNAGGAFGSSNTFTFNSGSGTLSVTNLTATGNLTSQSGYVYVDNGIIAVSSGNAGVFNTGISNINLGLAANVTIGSTTGNTTIRGTLSANNAALTNLSVDNYYSSRNAVTVTTDTIIDQFSVSSYRSAKYTMRVNSDDGYQAVEVLLVHDGSSSYVTIYGSISSSGSDIISMSSNIGSGNVRLFASTASTNTNVKILGTYVPD